ncbi:MAG: InlB B-repeat-containing protein [Oscillospiraceae bacterium]|nr:InlB B-repeat-containing protein [Oscillospiraceae bacterium]
MKKLNKMLAVALSLVLCLGMIAPAFAASFTELQGAIDSTENGLFGEKQDISASTDEQGNRNVTLLGDVVRGEGETDKSIVIDAEDGEVTIDLNGKNIDGNGEGSQHAVVEVKGGDLTIKDSTAVYDEEGKQTYAGDGKITGGNHQTVVIQGNIYPSSTHGGGVYVGQNGSLTLDSGAISGNHADQNGGGVYVGTNSTFTMNGGLIDHNDAGHSGGGVYTQGSFTMENGKISGNTAEVAGGGVNAYNKDFTMKGGEISGNTANIGGGVAQTSKGTFIMEDGKITGNTSHNSGGGVSVATDTGFKMSGGEISSNESALGGGICNQGVSTVTGGEITKNTANYGGGVYNINSYGKDVSFKMTDGTLANNSAEKFADDVYSGKDAIIALPGAEDMGAKLEDGTNVTGWYFDGVKGWGNDGNPYFEYEKVNGKYDGLSIKAAHDQYFNVTFDLGYEGAENVTTSLEKGSDFPAVPTVPTRPNFTFTGWVDENGSEVDLENLPETVTADMTLVARWEAIPAVDIPDGGDTGTDTEIDEPAVPLAAGPVTRAEFLDYLWRHEGEPESDGVCAFEDVPEDHPFILALAWAEQNGIAFANEDGTFQPDELVTVGAVREFLNNFAQAFGTNAVAAADLASLSGDDDEAVLNCDEVLAEFFGEEYAAPAENEAA